VISVSFYCVHTEPRAPRVPFALLHIYHWALDCLERFQSVHHACASVRYRDAPEALSYQNPHRRSNQLWQGFLRVSYLVLEYIALGLAGRLGDSEDYQLFSNPGAHRSIFRVFSSVVIAIGVGTVYDPLVGTTIPPDGGV
jgi:hypothetical protein